MFTPHNCCNKTYLAEIKMDDEEVDTMLFMFLKFQKKKKSKRERRPKVLGKDISGG